MNKIKHAIALMVFVLIGTTAFAQPACVAPEVQQDIVIDLTGLESVDGPGAPGNTVLTVCNPALANGQITFITAENIVLEPLGASWCSESDIDFGGVIVLTPHTENNPGPCAPFNDPGTDLVANGLPTIPLDADGCVVMEISESFVDDAGQADAIYASGLITLSGCAEEIVEEAAPIPTLGEWGLISLALLMVIFGITYMRREQTKSNSSLA